MPAAGNAAFGLVVLVLVLLSEPTGVVRDATVLVRPARGVPVDAERVTVAMSATIRCQ